MYELWEGISENTLESARVVMKSSKQIVMFFKKEN